MNYSDANHERYLQTNGRLGMRVDLGIKGGTFWSKGWRGCEWCSGDVRQAVTLYPFREIRNGVEVTGWRCKP